jgi:two-component system, chemotaxis family, response regulator PixH
MKPSHWIGSPSIFIIDSSIADCRLMSIILQRAGCKVDFTVDGREGLIRVLEDPPQCLILDATLPGTSGYAICRHIRAVDQHYTIPIIIVSAKNTPLDQKYSLRMGANSFLAKPISEEALLQTVKKLLPGFSLAAMVQTRPPFISQPGTSEALAEKYTLIPHRLNEDEILLRRNPFASSNFVSDKHLRRLYAVINGRRNVQELAEMVQLDPQATLKLLKTLWQQQQIAFHDRIQQPLKELSLLDNIELNE